VRIQVFKEKICAFLLKFSKPITETQNLEGMKFYHFLLFLIFVLA